jgi:murein DD-endopeptidase MepM/ murein hydrolase activator NlpD
MPPPYAVPGRPTAHRTVPRGGGETIEVQPGETLYSIARRHGVAVSALKEASGLTGDTVRPGQRLVLPASSDREPYAKAPPVDELPERPFAKVPGASRGLLPGAQPPPGWDGRYVMRNGDTLNAIAIRHGVSVDDLMQANNITDPGRLWSGTVLAVPDRQAAVSEASKGPPRIIQVPPRIINAVPEAPATKTAKRGDIVSDAGSSAPAGFTGNFRWPARGKLVAGFGKRPDGKHNDGINILLPRGTDIVASESGKVAYAGNELKGYGNLVLIRHPNGWVTAYAHADQLLVSYDQEVRRGQVIAKAGKTGSVDEPQLHFEIRRDARPVDPMPHLGN